MQSNMQTTRNIYNEVREPAVSPVRCQIEKTRAPPKHRQEKRGEEQTPDAHSNASSMADGQKYQNEGPAPNVKQNPATSPSTPSQHRDPSNIPPRASMPPSPTATSPTRCAQETAPRPRPEGAPDIRQTRTAALHPIRRGSPTSADGAASSTGVAVNFRHESNATERSDLQPCVARQS